jgi:hypothetical protein
VLFSFHLLLMVFLFKHKERTKTWTVTTFIVPFSLSENDYTKIGNVSINNNNSHINTVPDVEHVEMCCEWNAFFGLILIHISQWTSNFTSFIITNSRFSWFSSFYINSRYDQSQSENRFQCNVQFPVVEKLEFLCVLFKQNNNLKISL